MDDDKVQEADVIEETEVEITVGSDSSQDQATVLSSLDELIKSYVSSIDNARLELKKHREMFEDTFINNPTYREASEQVKEISKKKAEVRTNIMKQPAVSQLATKIKDLRLETKEKEASLSEYLLEYQRLTNGLNQIEVGDGLVLDIVNSARLVRRTSK